MPEKRELRWAFPSTRQRRRDRWITAGVLVVWFCLFILGHPNPPVTAQTKPAGEMWWSLDVTLAPAWFDPGEVVGLITSFWVLYAMHDALVKPLPGNLMTPSLAESWTMSADQLVYEFKLREGLRFHNGDPFTAEDVKFSFLRCKGAKLLREKVCDIEIVDPHRVRLAANYAIDRVALSELAPLEEVYLKEN